MTEAELKAIALRYPEWADAPYIAAKAKGHKAAQLVKIAKKDNVPIVQDAALADVLSIQSVGQYIPEETYLAIATIFAFMLQMK